MVILREWLIIYSSSFFIDDIRAKGFHGFDLKQSQLPLLLCGRLLIPTQALTIYVNNFENKRKEKVNKNVFKLSF